MTPEAVRAVAALLLLLLSAPAFGQTAARAPAAPQGVNVEAGGRTVRAIRLQAPPNLDGRLDEAHYLPEAAAGGFIQNEPRPGAPATERTEVWVAYDDRNVYVSVRAWESAPDRMIVKSVTSVAPPTRR